ncbi:hypothetical protein HYPSUDRAFT_811163 [Hypholoma sublateritium FD-334 SS-4]|uniref:Uncharacterized protein n=1 Tax=Hypholoma sublateritium (strain FD-334 SS-4) TaxID=945553 RepID=A0A0D2PII8_HYPSF|nr:hypothetical protein HYPSUDRAFT_811163 [Hypholoma sublateritium FD-334 SS-4]
MEDLEPGRSKGQWDHSGYTELQLPTGLQKKFDNDRGRGRGKLRGRGSGRKKGIGRLAADEEVEVDNPEKSFKEWGPARSKQPKEPTPGFVDIPWGDWGPDPLAKAKEVTPPAAAASGKEDLALRQPKEDKAPARETAWGEWGLASSIASIAKEDGSPTEAIGPVKGKWDSTPPATDSERPSDDFNDWGHAPHKTKVAAAKKREASQKDPGLGSGISTIKDAAKSPGGAEIEKKNEMASPHRPAASDATGDWGLWSVSQVPQDEIWKKPPKKSKAFYDEPVVAIGPSNQDAPKDAKSQGKGKERVIQDDLGSEPEDWGMDLVAEQPPANTSESAIRTSESEYDCDSGNWGASQGGSSENWGLPADPFPSTTDNLEEVELHTQNTSTLRSERDPHNASASELSKEILKSLKCPTHNYRCNENFCKDMARLVKEEETKLRSQVIDSDGKVFSRDHNTHDFRKTPPWRPTGSKRGHRPKREVQKIGQLRGFSDDDMDRDALKPKKVRKKRARMRVAQQTLPIRGGLLLGQGLKNGMFKHRWMHGLEPRVSV